MMLSENQLRPYQLLSIDHLIENPKCALWSFMGSGKTVSTLTAIDRLRLAGIEEKPTLVIAPLRVAKSVWPEEVTKWSHLNHLKVIPILGSKQQRLDALQEQADVYTINFENLEWLIGLLWDRWPFGAIVVDECFPAGTLVDTPNGQCAIETLRVGDTVLNVTGEDRVVGCYTREISEFVNITVGSNTITCSPNHPFFTQRGWVPAAYLTTSDILVRTHYAMRLLSENTHSSADSSGWEVLREILLSEMANVTTGHKEESALRGSGKKNFSIIRTIFSKCIRSVYASKRSDEKDKSWEKTFSKRETENFRAFERDSVGAESARGKWLWNDTERKTFIRRAWERMVLQLRCSIKKIWLLQERRVSDCLQDRCRQQRVENSNRSGRVFPFQPCQESSGRKENESALGDRVESIAFYKSGSPEFLARSGGKDTITLYDLQIERHPSYSVNGCVVHNSTKLKSLRASVRRNKQGTDFVAGKGTQRAKSLLKVVYQHKPSRFIELTGTPSPNGLQDLWGQIYFLDYGKRLGNIFDAFRSRWFEQDFTGYGIKPKQHAQVQIETALKDICLSLRSEDWFDLEKPIVENIYVDLPSHVQAEYRRMEKTLLAEIRGERIEAFNAGARTMKCRQLAAGACYTGSPGDPGPRNWLPVHDNKLDALEEIVEEASGQPILVAYDFAFDLERLLKRFPKGRKLDKNPKTIEEWNAGRIPLLFAHPASAGHGLNLQHGSNILVYFTYNWNFEEHSQILERIGPVRQFQAGYKRNVYVYKIVTRGTIDEDVLESHESKRSIQDVLMENLSRRARG